MELVHVYYLLYYVHLSPHMLARLVEGDHSVDGAWVEAVGCVDALAGHVQEASEEALHELSKGGSVIAKPRAPDSELWEVTVIHSVFVDSVASPVIWGDALSKRLGVHTFASHVSLVSYGTPALAHISSTLRASKDACEAAACEP